MGLFGDAKLSATVLGPSGFARSLGSREFSAEAYGLNPVVSNALGEEGLADGLCASFAEAAIVFRGAALVGETCDDDGFTLFEGSGDFRDFWLLRTRHSEAVEPEIDRLETCAVDVSAEK